MNKKVGYSLVSER